MIKRFIFKMGEKFLCCDWVYCRPLFFQASHMNYCVVILYVIISIIIVWCFPEMCAAWLWFDQFLFKFYFPIAYTSPTWCTRRMIQSFLDFLLMHEECELPKGLSKSVRRRKTDNTMAKRNRIYNYIMYLSLLMLWVRISIRGRCTTLYDKVCQWLATGRWFFSG